MSKTIITALLIVGAVALSGCIDIDKQEYAGNNSEVKFCYDQVNSHSDGVSKRKYIEAIQTCKNIEKLESYQFLLKEMKQKDLTQGSVSGSFLLIGGSIYGTVEDKMYLVVTYYDQRISTYKITKFNLEQIEINTIDKNMSAYFQYKAMPESTWYYPFYKYDAFTARLYLPDGWSII